MSEPTQIVGTDSVQNSSMAIVSLVFGILGLTLLPVIGSIVAVITGPIAKREIYESAGGLKGEGVATAGQVMGWIGIALSFFGICAGCCFLVWLPVGILSSVGQYGAIPSILFLM
jgi:hypothetical protein